MPNWKKVITSGSTAVLNEITSSGGIYSAQDIYSRESKLGRDTYIERELTLGTEPSEDTTTNTNIQFLSRDKSNGVIKHHTLGSLAFSSATIPTVNNANITINAGSSALTLNGTAGGSEIFTTNQGIAEQITIDHATNGSQGSVNNSGNTVIQDVTLDGYGHVTGLTSKTLSIPSISGLTSCTGTVTSVTTGNSCTITIGGTATDPTVEANTAAVANGGAKLATGDQIYDHVTTRISGLTSCTGTTTPSNSQTFTNKSGNISQWTNDAGYITDGNTGWNNSYGFTSCTGTVDTSGTPANNQIAIFTDSDTIEGDANFTWDGSKIFLANGKHIQFTDQQGTYPTNQDSKFKWLLNNDSYEHYAFQPASDQIDVVFKITDNVGSTDRFVFWIDDYKGETYDAYPLYMDGNNFVVNAAQKYNSGTAYSNNVDFYVAASGSTSATSNPVIKADVSLSRVGIGTNSPSSTLDVDGIVTLSGFILDGNTITGVDDSGEFTDNDGHIMTSAGVNDRIDSRISGLTSCTGTTTPSNTQTFTNKSGNISQWTNDSGYITDGNTNWNNSYGFTTCTGTTTPSNTQTFTNKSGNISQWTNDSGYTSCTGTSNLTIGTTATTALAGNTTVDDVSVTNLKTALAGGFGSNAVQIGDSTDTVTIPGELVVTGTVTTNNVETVSTSNGVVFEGNAADANEVLLIAGTVTSDRTITLPDATGTVALKSQIPTHTSCITNDSGFITDGNTNWNNTYGFTTCTGTTTPSNTQTFTNKSGNISQWTNDSGFTTCTGTVNTSGTVNSCEFPRFSDADTVVALTATEMRAALNIADGATNVTNNNQLTNGCGYITDGNTNWNNSYGFTTCTGTVTGVTSADTDKIYVGGTAAAPTIDAKTGAVTNGGVNLATGDQIYDHVTTRISGLTSCTGTVTMSGGVNNRIVTAGGTTSLIGESGLTYDGSSFCVSSQGNFFNAQCSEFGDDNAGVGKLVIGDDNFGGELGIMTDDDEAIAVKVGSSTFEYGGIEPFDASIKVKANTYNVLLNKTSTNTANGSYNVVGGNLNTATSYYSIIGSGCNNNLSGGVYYNSIVGGLSNAIQGNGSLCISNFIGGGQTNCICMGHSQAILGGAGNKIHDSACAIKSESRANWAVVVGGNTNHINGACYAFIGSGYNNCVCQSNSAVVAGGCSNDILTSNYSTIAGGHTNCISGTCAVYGAIGGGRNNSILAHDGAIPGGYLNCIQGMGSGNYSVIGGGSSNKTCAQYATIGGGFSNNICRTAMVQSGTGGTIAGGRANCVSGNYASVGGGCTNIIACQGSCATIAGGHSNCNHSPSSTIGGGAYNCIIASQGIYSVIGGGYSNCIATACCGQTIGGGKDNYICTGQYGQSGTIAGGCNNKVCGNNISSATVVGGSANCAKATGTVVGGVSAVANHSYATVFGCCLTSTAQKTAYFNNATIACHLQVGGTTTMSSTTGRIDATNDVVAYATSDRRLKENIKPIENALCKVIGVTGNTFDWKELSEQEIKDIHGNKGNDVGVIAQEIEEVLPQAVTTRDSGYKAVNYEKLIPLLIEAIKDQQKQIDELKDKVNGSS